MKKIMKLIMIASLAMIVSVSTASAEVPENFVPLNGGSKPETQHIEVTDRGIVVSGEGSYTPDGQAAGLIYQNPVDPRDVTVVFTIDEIPTLNPIQGSQWSQERDSWYAVSILDKPQFWTTANDEVKSFTLAISPISRDRAYVHAFRTFAGGFFQVNWLETIDLKKGTQVTLNIKWNDKTVSATINGVNIPLDTFNNEQLPTIDPVFGDQVYVAVSGQTGANKAQFTLQQINDVSFVKDSAQGDAVPAAPAAGESAVANPKTGDAGITRYYVMAAAAAIIMAVIVIGMRRQALK